MTHSISSCKRYNQKKKVQDENQTKKSFTILTSKSTLCGVLLPPFCFKKFQAREKLKEQYSEHQYTFHVLDSIIVNTLPNLLSFSLATCTHLFFFKHLKVNCRHDATPAFNLKNKDSLLYNYNTIMTFKKCNIDTIASK